MRPEHITALETRCAWRKWADTPDGQAMWSRLGYAQTMPQYIAVLERGELFCMTPHFEDLVEHARRTLPNDLAFDCKWMQAPWGFLWLAQPFEVGVVAGRVDPTRVTVRAIGWYPVAKGTTIRHTSGRSHETEADGFHVMTFQGLEPFGNDGFGCWSYMTITDGQRLRDRIDQFEEHQTEGQYERADEPLHELRWIYAAFYLMAQRLATTTRVAPDRATRRRMARAKERPPEFLRVVTLRRMEEARAKDGAHGNVDWQWRWAVRGHWRNQFHPSTGLHSPVFIEAYVKGPDAAPMKPDTLKLFVARR